MFLAEISKEGGQGEVRTQKTFGRHYPNVASLRTLSYYQCRCVVIAIATSFLISVLRTT